MKKDFTMTLLVDRSPEEVFHTVRDVRRWWSGLYEEEIKGDFKKLNDEFTFRAGGGAHYTKQKMIEVIPNKKVVWLVTEAELTFVEKRDEWEGTRIAFEISEKKNKTEIRFIHQGLTPEFECYDACSSAWSMYLREKLMALLNNPKN
jgi:hypothetical protein